MLPPRSRNAADRPTEVTVLRVDRLAKRYGATQALDGVDLSLRRGEVHALLGSNGSGKSTMVKLLAGIEQADAGVLHIGGRTIDARAMSPDEAARASLRVVHQEDATFAGLTVAENLAAGQRFPMHTGAGISWRALERRTQEVLDRFEIDARPRDPVDRLSPVNRRVLLIARALQDDDTFDHGMLILDEPTAALSQHEVELLLAGLRSYAAAGLAILYVTHRLGEVVGLADRATVLKDGRVRAVVERDEITTARLVELICGRSPAELEAAPRAERSPGEPRVEVRGLAGGAAVDATFHVRAGEIVGLAGIAGSGRSSLLQTIFGLYPPSAGHIRIDGKPQAHRRAHGGSIAYVPEDRGRDASFASLTLRENLSAADVRDFRRHGRIDHRLERSVATELIEQFGIRASSDRLPFAALSGGNQQKVVLARCIRRQPRLLLLDEPTAAVDVGARADIHALIRAATDKGCGALVASSDFEELTGLCDRVVVLRRGRTVAELDASRLSPTRLERIANEG